MGILKVTVSYILCEIDSCHYFPVSVSLSCDILAANEGVICSVRSVRNPFTIRDDRSTTGLMDFCVLS